MKIVIVGGVAGGATAATRLRRLNEDAEIVLIERGEYVSFSNCGLPYYIGGEMEERCSLIVQTPEGLRRRFNIDVRVENEVIKIDTQAKQIEVLDHSINVTYLESYDKLILSPGAKPVRPDWFKMDSERMFILRDVSDTDRIKSALNADNVAQVVIVGGGFIGLELAESARSKGLEVSIVELSDHVLSYIDYDMAAILHRCLRGNGVMLHLQDSVKEVVEQESYLDMKLASGKSLVADIALVTMGVKPENDLAKGAGLKVGETGGIIVNEFMQTSDENVYAIGDVVQSKRLLDGRYTLFPLAGIANKQARIVAANVLGKREKYESALGTAVTRIFEMTAAFTGLNNRTLRKYGIEHETSIIHASPYAEYFPGGRMLTIKMTFDKNTGKIFGAQVVGYAGVDKRIDVISTAIKAGMTVYDIAALELAYAPPYSSARDPVNTAGCIAADILNGEVAVFHWNELDSIDKNMSVLLDVRTSGEYSAGTIEGAINIPLDELRQRLNEISPQKAIYVFCQTGSKGYMACRILTQNGFAMVKNLSGGYKTYESATGK